MNRLRLTLSTTILAIAATVGAQDTQSLAAAVRIANAYRVVPNVSYLKTEHFDSKLDVYQSRVATTAIRGFLENGAVINRSSGHQ